MNSYFGASALPVPRNAGKQIADADRHLQQYAQPRSSSSSSHSGGSSFMSSLKQKLHRNSNDSQRKMLLPENINRGQIQMIL